MKFTHRHHFAADLDAVVAMFANPEFVRQRAKAAGAASADIVVDGTAAEAFTVSIRRSVPASSIPAEFRGFVGSELLAIYTEAWEAPSGEDRVGTFAVEIAGIPGHAAGAYGLTPEGDGIEFLATGEVNASVPLFGPMIERAVADAVVKALTAELQEANTWLASR